MSRFLHLGVLCLVSGCAGHAPRPETPRGSFRLRCTPSDATVYLDEEYRGPCRVFQRPVPLAPGPHKLQVDATGHYPYYGEFETGGTVQTLEVNLVPRPD